MRKGSITVFFALILSLMLALVCTSIESVRMAAARTQILSSVDIGLYSLFGQYDRTLLKDYDLFFLNGSGGGQELNLAAVYDNLESYMKPVLKQNSQKLSVVQGGFTGYRLATDEDGEVFYRQVVTYMKETLGAQGIQLLLDRFREKEEKVRQAEEAGEQAENGGTLENYDSEMDAAARDSQAAGEQENSGSGELTDGSAGSSGNSSGDISSGGGNPGGTVQTDVVNPIPILRRIRNMSLLDLVVPAQKGISENQVSKRELLSGRTKAEGMNMPGNVEADTSYSSQLLFQQYLSDKLGSYMKPAGGGLSYQMEYLLCGKDSDRENLKSVARRLLLVREGINFAGLLADSSKRMQVQALALAIASGFLIPPAAVIIEAALLFLWSFAESILDLRELLHGGKVPLVKNASNWQLSLENLPYLMEGLDSQRRSAEDGMDYEDYLQILLLAEPKNRKLERGMDMVEACIRSSTGNTGFRLDHCIEAIEASVDVQANRKKTFTVTKQYSYT